MKNWLTLLAVALSLMTFAPAHAENGDVTALRWDCMAMSTIMVGRSLGIPETQSNANDVTLLVATKFAKEQGITQGIARGRMRRAMAYFGGPVGATNECIERGWYSDHAN
jgi:hypothetical protein